MQRDKIVISCLAMALLLGAGQAGQEERPPYEPFKKWNAETPAEKRLDALITEVVTILDQGKEKADFGAWQGRDIASEYRGLRLVVPETVNAHYTGRNFLFLSRPNGTFFYARFKGTPFDYFVPSICRKRAGTGATAARRVSALSIDVEGHPYISPHSSMSRRQMSELFRKTVIPFWTMSCGAGVKLGFYDSATLRGHNRLYTHPKHKTDNEPPFGRWVGVSIYYPRD